MKAIKRPNVSSKSTFQARSQKQLCKLSHASQRPVPAGTMDLSPVQMSFHTQAAETTKGDPGVS